MGKNGNYSMSHGGLVWENECYVLRTAIVSSYLKQACVQWDLANSPLELPIFVINKRRSRFPVSNGETLDT